MSGLKYAGRWGLLAVPALSAVLVGMDRLVDPGPIGNAELALDFFESALLVGVMMASALVVLRMTDLERNTAGMHADLERARRDGESWRRQSRRLVSSLTDAISQQFDAWGLTPAEADIAGLMLKGMSLKEIAALRKTSEATIRQQAQGIYRKSALSNRAELSAYFLEDLFGVAEEALPHVALAEKVHQSLN